MVKYKTMLSASSVTWLTANFSAYALLVNTTSMMAKIMKLSSLALGLVVATSGFIALSDSSKAATLNLNGLGLGGAGTSSITYDTAQLYEFTFLSSNGSYQSNFVSGTNKITEKAPFDIPVAGDFTGSCAICSFVSTISGNFSLETVVPNLGSVSASTNAMFSGDANLFTIRWNDQFQGDRDFNDFRVQARAVPVPAIVPGIALAAAFFGSKALKRNKKDASGYVA